MKHQHSTWYLLVDGTHADPNDVSPGDDGVLRHKNGLAVALHADGTPQSIGRDAVDNKNVEAAEVGESDAPAPDGPKPATPKEPLLATTEVLSGDKSVNEARADAEKPPLEKAAVEKALEPKAEAPPKVRRDLKPARNRAKYKTR